MPTIHVQGSIQFRSDLYAKRDRTEWFNAVGAELEKRKLSITLAPGVVVKNAADLTALMQRYSKDGAGLQTQLNLPAGTTLQNYVQDLLQGLDDVVKETSDVKDMMVDLGPSSEFGKLLGLDTSSRYGSSTTAFGKAKGVDQTIAAGAVTVSKNAASADPLAGQLYIDSKTFAGTPRFSFGRDAVELEQVSGVSGVDPKVLLEALRQTNSNGRTTFQRLRKPENCEAYTVGYSGVGLDDMRWDGDAHAQREANKFVSLVVEGGRFEPAAAGEPREISVGTDKMDDVYYDTKNFDLMDADFTVRGRARWDTDTEIRRILVAVKSNTVIDDFGLKRNGKVDVRNDGASAEEIKNLDRDIRTGSVQWRSSGGPLKPLKGVYDALSSAGKLPDVGPHQDVLQMEPKVHIRSVRSRYHLNESSLESVKEFYKNTQAKLPAVLEIAKGSLPALKGDDQKTAEALITQGTALQDGSALLPMVADKLKALDPKMTVDLASVQALMPSLAVAWNSPKPDALTVEKKKVVAEAMDQAYHAFAEQLDGARRVICQSQDRALENHPAMFRDWLRTVDTSLVTKNAYEPFLAKYDAMAAKPEAELAKDLEAFNAYGKAQQADGNDDFEDFTPLDAAGFKALRAQVLNEVVRINTRQLEAAGSTALTLWFDEARALYVPESRRNTGNFLIDTTDMSEYLTHDAWESIAEGDRTPAHQLPIDKVFHATLVNETQIELGLEQPYLKRLDALNTSIETDRASLVMKFMDSSKHPGIDAAKVESYSAALKAVLEGPADARDGFISKLNAFMRDQKSALVAVDAKNLGSLEGPGLFTKENRDKAVRTEGTVEQQLAGAQFVFQQYIEVQKAVVASKEDRVKSALRSAGVRGAEWTQTEKSKGITALEKVREGVK